MKTISFNQIIVEAYIQSRTPKEERRNGGFVMIAQRGNIVGLKVLIPFKNNQIDIKENDVIYITEQKILELYKNSYKLEVNNNKTDQSFMAINLEDILYVEKTKE